MVLKQGTLIHTDISRRTSGAKILSRGIVFSSGLKKRMGMIATNPPVITFLHSLEPVTDKGTHEKDDHIEDDPDKETDTAYQAQAEPKVPGSKEKCNQPEDDRQNDADDRPCFEEPPEIFLPFS